jgi:hypothetical protein
MPSRWIWLMVPLITCTPDWTKNQPDDTGDWPDGGSDADTGSDPVADDPRFPVTEVPEDQAAFGELFSKYTSAFHVHVFATDSVPDADVQHCARVIAQYLDNDEDGVADDPSVIAALQARGGAGMVMFGTEREIETSGIFDSELPERMRLQGLYATETFPEGSEAAGRFDATLEEVLHLLQTAGISEIYQEGLGISRESALAEAMDLARGGHFETVPDDYPESAWYHYDDRTCDYECMLVEYFYWGLTSLMGGQAYDDRCEEIAHEWEACTPDQVQAMDPALYALLTHPEYKLPTILPDATYR